MAMRFNYSQDQKRKAIFDDPWTKVNGKEKVKNEPAMKLPVKKETGGPRVSKENLSSRVSEEGRRKAGDLATKRREQAIKKKTNGVYRENYMAKESYDREMDEYERWWNEQKRKNKW